MTHEASPRHERLPFVPTACMCIHRTALSSIFVFHPSPVRWTYRSYEPSHCNVASTTCRLTPPHSLSPSSLAAP